MLSAAFGAGDQYLGSGQLWGIGWPTDVSLLSAPWLVLAFVAGSTLRDPRRAALLVRAGARRGGARPPLLRQRRAGFELLIPQERNGLSKPA